jgi:hypothetical protein
MRSGDMQAIRNLVRLVHNPHLDHMNLVHVPRLDHKNDRCSMCSLDRNRRT